MACKHVNYWILDTIRQSEQLHTPTDANEAEFINLSQTKTDGVLFKHKTTGTWKQHCSL